MNITLYIYLKETCLTIASIWEIVQPFQFSIFSLSQILFTSASIQFI